MVERFIKFIPSEQALWLLQNHPNAFLLLTLIAQRARRYSGHIDGLEIGECHLGDYEKAGIESRQNYRTALQLLIDLKIIEKLETCRTRKKSTTGTTTNGTKVRLLDSSIWDINPESSNHQSNHRVTTDQPPGNHEQERIKKEKKEEEKKEKIKKEKVSEKISYREFVFLTEKEFSQLLAAHPPHFVDAMLDELNSYKGSNGKEYKSDYHTMSGAGWVLKKLKNPSQQSSNLQGKPQVDRRTKNKDGIPISSPAENLF